MLKLSDLSKKNGKWQYENSDFIFTFSGWLPVPGVKEDPDYPGRNCRDGIWTLFSKSKGRVEEGKYWLARLSIIDFPLRTNLSYFEDFQIEQMLNSINNCLNTLEKEKVTA